MDDGALSTDLGPIDYVVVRFPAGTTDLAGPLALELASLVDAELIRVLDLVVIARGTDGRYEVWEFEDLAARGALGELDALTGDLAEVLALEDIERVVEALADHTTAAVFVWENTWAEPFADAARRSGGQILATDRIPTDVFLDALAADGTSP